MPRKPLSAKLRALVLSRDRSRCLMCGETPATPGVTLEVDHVVAVDDGGTDDLENLATLCRRCNVGKSNLRLKDYRSFTLVPDGVNGLYRYYHDAKMGDFERFHLYLYYNDLRGEFPERKSFHREWIISGSEWESSPDQQALKARRMSEETAAFEAGVRLDLATSCSRLLLTERGLERVAL